MIDLSKFCESKGSARIHLQRPWRKGDWVYATNGHLLVRVKPEMVADAAQETLRQPDVEALFTRYLDGCSDLQFIPMPTTPQPDPCPNCGGKGNAWSVLCPDCNEGTFMRGNHEYDCRNCADSSAGPGWVDSSEDNPQAKIVACHECDGLGSSIRFNGNFYIGDAGYSLVYAYMVSQLPGPVLFAPGDRSTNETRGVSIRPGVFRFAGGDGILMPRRD